MASEKEVISDCKKNPPCGKEVEGHCYECCGCSPDDDHCCTIEECEYGGDCFFCGETICSYYDDDDDDSKCPACGS